VFNELNDTDTVRRIVANERTMAGLAEYSLRMTSRLNNNVFFYCSGREVILDVFSQLNYMDTVRRIFANERTMAGQTENGLRMTSF
jgi:hypothetical protein